MSQLGQQVPVSNKWKHVREIEEQHHARATQQL